MEERDSAKRGLSTVLIVTYGRTGSTLLQGILNTIPGYYITGENNNFLFRVYESYQALLDAKTLDYAQSAKDPSHPWYGATAVDLDAYVRSCAALAYQTLVPESMRSTVRCFGFKEIRYVFVTERLEAYLRFLKRILPNCKFLFNVRNLDDVLKSAWWATGDLTKAREQLRTTEIAFERCLSIFPDDSFLVRYEDIIANAQHLPEMFQFIGERYSKAEIDGILKVVHSTRTERPGSSGS